MWVFDGGFLVIHAKDLLSSPYAWKALKNCLVTKEVNIEGLGRQLNDELDLWQTAKPVLETIFKKQQKKKIKTQLKELTKLPQLTLDVLTQLKQPQVTNTKELNQITAQLKTNNQQQKIIIWLLLGLGILSIYLIKI